MPKAEIRNLNGYRVILMPEHPRAMRSKNWYGYVYEHIVVAEQGLGRAVKGGEVIHHLDGNRANNTVRNLLVLERGQHTKLHEWLNQGAPGVERLRKNGVNSRKPKPAEPRYCAVCGRSVQSLKNKYCSSDCAGVGRRRACRPTRNELKSLIESPDRNWSAMGREYGVSDNTVRKWARAYGLAW